MASSTKTTTTSAPPSWAQGTITNALGAEQSGYTNANNTFQQYRPYQDAAINQAYGAMTNPAPFVTAARSNLANTINGQYLTPGSNPYEASMGQQIANQAQGGYNASFGAAGRAHGGLSALLSSQGVGNALDNFYGGIYQQERGLQQQATLAEPAFNADQFTPATALNQDINTTAMGPSNAAALFGQSVNNTTGQYGTVTQRTQQPFGLQQILGLGLAAAGAATGNPAMAMGGLSSAANSGGGYQYPSSLQGAFQMPGGNLQSMFPSLYGGGI